MHRIPRFLILGAFVLLSGVGTSLARAPNSVPPTDLADLGRPAFRVFTDRDGLPQNAVLCMTVDSSGYLWVGTQDGAAYWNGRAWSVVNMPNRLVANDVTAMVASRDGRMWFGTTGGLVRFRDGVWTTFTADNSPIPNNAVYWLAETSPPTGIWIGTANGLARLENDRWTVFTSKNSSVPEGPVNAVLETVSPAGGHVVWIGTMLGGLASLADGRWTVFNVSNSGLPHNNVWTLLKTDGSDGGELWAGTNGGGLTRFVPATGAWQRFDTGNSAMPSNSVKSLAETVSPSGKRTLWIGTDGGLVRRTDNRWTVLDTKNSPLPNNAVAGLCPTPAAGGLVMWAGTNGGGLAAIVEGSWTALDARNSGLPSNAVWSMLETTSEKGQSVHWIGIYGDGLVRYETGNRRIFNTSNSGLSNNQITALFETVADGKRILWAGTDGGGLCRFDGRTWTTHNQKNSPLPSDNVFCLRPAGGGKGIWIGTPAGLARLENDEWTVFHKGDSGFRVFDVIETRSAQGRSEVWAAVFSQGLMRHADGQWTTLDARNSRLPNNQPLCLLETTSESGGRTLWVGLFGGGVARFDPDRPDRPWLVLSDSTSPALPNNTVYQIREDARKRLYLMTNKGVVRLTPRAPTTDNPAEYNATVFTVEDGLPGNEGNQGASMIDSKGRVWMGTVGGIGIFDPREASAEQPPAPLRIERVLLNGKSHPANLADLPPALAGPVLLRDAALRYNENNLVFEFALLTRFKGTETRYRTQLVGLDAEASTWTADARKEYTTLPAGTYTFRVWARDFTGTVVGPVEATFTVRPAPWLTWWAFLFYGGAVTGLAYGGHRYRLRVLETRTKELETKIAERTVELASALDQLRQSNKETERKNEELAVKNEELMESQRRADRIFSALAEALPGTVLDGKYRLDEKIGEGGFGAVYRAVHVGMRRPVAVKIFRPKSGNDSAEALERFRLEAVSACRVNHPNAVSVLDSGVSTEGIAYLVMELLAGHALAEEMDVRKVLSLERTAQILLPVCDALAQAHAAGIVHRDIKPDNIFLHQAGGEEIVKVVDFGIAKFLENVASLNLQSLTVTGGFIGTPGYMAPERLEGVEYDGKSDVYSLGVVMYEMLCGRMPFEAGSGGLLAVIRKQLFQEPPSLKKFNPNVTEAVEAVVLRALSKNPNERPTAKELGREFPAAANLTPEQVAAYRAAPIDLSVQPTDVPPELRPMVDATGTSSPTKERLDEIKKLLFELAECPPDRRERRFDETVADDPGLRETLQRLLSTDEQQAKDTPSTVRRWPHIEALFFEALEHAPDERQAFLDRACGGDAFLRDKVEALLAADAEVNE